MLVDGPAANAAGWFCLASDDTSLRNCVTTGQADGLGTAASGDTVAVNVQNNFEVLSTVAVPAGFIVTLTSDAAALGGPFTLTRAVGLTDQFFDIPATSVGAVLSIADLTLDGNKTNVAATESMVTAENGTLNLQGGAVLQNSSGGAAAILGGAVWVSSTASTSVFFTMTGNATVTGNTVHGRGGGIELSGPNTVGLITDNAVVSLNTAMETTPGTYGGGGGIYVDGSTLAITGSAQVTGNMAHEGGGLNIEAGAGGSASLTVSDYAQITNNTVEMDLGGGGIEVRSREVGHWISVGINGHASVSNNTAPGWSGGGGMRLQLSPDLGDVTASVSDQAIFSGNQGMAGAGISSHAEHGTASLTISGEAQVTGNIANSPTSESYGAGIYAEYPGSSVRLTDNAQVTANQSNGTAAGIGGGGAMVDDGASMVMDSNSAVTDNTAATLGGGISVCGGSLTMSGMSTVSGNSAPTGGGIQVASCFQGTEPASATITDQASVTGNTADSQGGGVFVGGTTGTLTMNGGTVSQNTAAYGGGIYVLAASQSTTINAGTIFGNSATGPDGPMGSGGGVYTELFAKFTAGKGSGTVTFTGNTAPSLRTKHMIQPGDSIDGAATDDLTDYASHIGPATPLAVVAGLLLDPAVMSSPIGVAGNAPAYNNYDVNYAFGQIDLVKSASPSDPALFRVGQQVTYSFDVTNTGTDRLNPVVVSDPLPGLSAIVCPATSLAPAAAMTCTATYTITEADVAAGILTNTATVTGTPPQGRPASASDSVTLHGRPGIAVVKSATPSDLGSFKVGQLVTYSFLVTNTGTAPLKQITVSDPLPGLSAVACPAAGLVPGAAMTCTATYTITAADVAAGKLDNTVTATGTPPTGPPVSSSDSLRLPVPPSVKTGGSTVASGGAGDAGLYLLLLGLALGFVWRHRRRLAG